jgi:putative ABC transport system ATP-binding protein
MQMNVTGASTMNDRQTTPANDLLLRTEKLAKVYYTEEVETHALQNINLKIRRGEYVAILGPSGGGKTSLLSVLGLLSTPTSGEYWLNGTEASELDTSERAQVRNREIGFIFQSFNLIGDLNVFENVELPLIYRSGIDKSEREDRIRSVLERVGMLHRIQHYPGQLSGGQQQRIAVARALVSEPAILMADEPTGNLDSENGEAVMELLDGLHKQGATLLMVTHDPRYATRAARTVHLFDGQIVDEDIVDHASPAPPAAANIKEAR